MKISFRRIISFIIIITIFAGSIGATFAMGILASPGGFDLKFKEGKIYNGQLIVENLGNEAINITVDKKRIQKDNLHIIFSDTGAATWITVNPDEFVLGPHEKKVVKFKVIIPNNVSYYDAVGALVIQGHSSNSVKVNGNQKPALIVNQVPELVVPISMGLPGPIVESLQLLDHKSPSLLFSFMPGTFEYNLKNNGTVVANINGSVEITGLFGKQELYMNGKVFPGDNYYMFTKWEPSFWDLGIYEAKTTINYGREQQDKNISTSDTILVIPVWLILLILLILGIWIVRKKEIEPPIRIKIEKR